MEININEPSHIVEVWLSHADQADPQIMKELLALRDQYRGTKYMVVEFHSGQEDLYAQSRDLLLHNRTCAAAAQVQQLM